MIVHTHGGAFFRNGGVAATMEGALIANATKIPVVSIDYRMLHDHAWSSPLEDCLLVWKELLKDHDASRMGWAGTSAGGNLALVMPLKFRQEGLPTPAVIMAGTPLGLIWIRLVTGRQQSLYIIPDDEDE